MKVRKYADRSGTLWDPYADYVKYGDAFTSNGPIFMEGVYTVESDQTKLPDNMALPPRPRTSWAGEPV